ncbi:sigma-70 family RNA polymerase sigma factor [Rubrimonas cliftonensis]|uniref:RNA polymerase sigma-70 factor, ECF subfamily n=1 Tax=Rubrimonas cliftonensis TaxID=89524 RepID=A0A1H4CI29_9RHOB|nr:sigma-70 family RNA polymerase sigma factor [Rubrimonas cliftonensis]SEA60004.1 RNA polymerase sigma-70 factor, ECF subfamily [Rubrimonas cliftonensis]
MADDGGDATETRLATALRSANTGDAAAYETFLSEAADLLRAGARARLSRLGFGAHEAEDVVQETLMALHLKRATWDGVRPVLPWIRAIARHKALDAARRLGRLRARTHAQPVEDWADILAGAPDAEPAAEAAPEGVVRARLAEALKGRERGVVAALGLEGLSVAAAAARFAISEGAVRVAFHRGLARLRASAAAEGEGEGRGLPASAPRVAARVADASARR